MIESLPEWWHSLENPRSYSPAYWTLHEQKIHCFYFKLPRFCNLTSSATSFPGGPDGKESTCSSGDLGSIPGLGRPPGGGHGNPLQDSCLENFMDSRAWRATVHAVTRVGYNWATKHSIMLKDTDFLSRWHQGPDFLPILFFFFSSHFSSVYIWYHM